MNACSKQVCYIFFLLFAVQGAQAQSIEDLRNRKNALLEEEQKARKELSRINENIGSWVVQIKSAQRSYDLQRKIEKSLQSTINVNKKLKTDLVERQDSVRTVYLNRKDQIGERAQAYYINNRLKKSRSWTDWSPGKRLKDKVYLAQYQNNIKNRLLALDSMQLSIEQDQLSVDSILVENKTKLKESKSISAKLKTKKQGLEENRNKLKKEKKGLNDTIKEKQKELKKINSEIIKVIAAADKTNKRPENVELSTKFKENKGKFPLPLDQATLLASFGEQRHAVLRQVKVFNNGIDLSSSTTEMNL